MRHGRKPQSPTRTPFEKEAKLDVRPESPQIKAIPLVTDMVSAGIRATKLSGINASLWDVSPLGVTRMI